MVKIGRLGGSLRSDLLCLQPPGDPTRVGGVIDESVFVGVMEDASYLRHLQVVHHGSGIPGLRTHTISRWLLHVYWNNSVDLEGSGGPNVLSLQPFPTDVQVQLTHPGS